MRTKKITIERIAEDAGVSKSTVSLVLLNKEGVGEETRRRVLEIAHSLGYSLRRKARPVERASHQGLDVIFLVKEHFFIVAEYFYSRIFQGIKEVLEADGYHPIFSTISEEQLENGEIPPIMHKETLAGLIIGGEMPASFHDLLERVRVPVIIVGDEQPTRPWCCILNDNYAAGELAVRHLLDLGHRRIACLANRSTHPNIRARVNGFWLTLLRHGGVFDRKLMLEDDAVVSIDEGYRLTKQLLQRGTPFTAIMATTDATAIGAMNALTDSGLRIPDEVSVIGIDNLEWGSHVNPPLTTVDLDRRQWGNLAADCLIHQIRMGRNRPLSHSRIVMPVHLLERASTKRLG